MAESTPAVSQPNATVQERPSFVLNWPHQILSVIGFAISLYSYRLHLIVHSGQKVSCGSSDTLDCNAALSSTYAEIMRIPLGVFGMLYFAVLFILSIDTDLRPEALRRSAITRLVVATGGFAFSLYLIYILKTHIKVWCPTCLATHLTNFLVFGFAVLSVFLRRRNADADTAPAGEPPAEVTAFPDTAENSR